MDGTRTSLDIAVFQFGSPILARALQRARSRGVSIRVVLDGHPPSGGSTEVLRGGVLAPGDMRRLKGISRQSGAMHHKFAIFDQECVVTGSYNWTSGAEHVNYENALLTDDPDTTRAYRREFDLLWRRAREVSRIAAPRRSTGSRQPTRRTRRFKRKKLREISRSSLLK